MRAEIDIGPAREQIVEVPHTLAVSNQHQFPAQDDAPCLPSNISTALPRFVPAVLAHTVRALHATLLERLRQDALVGSAVFAARGWVSQVVGDASESETPASYAAVRQPGGQLLVFRTPADHVFIEAIDALEIGTPGGEVAAIRGDKRVGEPSQCAAQQRSPGRIQAP